VGSGGTITGVSQKIKEVFPNAKIIAVDIEGSVIFGGLPKKRHIYGMGSSIVPEVLKKAKIDDVVTIDEIFTVEMCHELLERHTIFAGGSSGLVFALMEFDQHCLKYLNKSYSFKAYCNYQVGCCY